MLSPLRTLLLVLLAAAIPAWAADRASLSEVGSRPVANAGPALSARILVAVTLDGSASHDAQSAARGGQGGPVAFAWTLVQAPPRSGARIDAGVPAPQFVPDVPGVYAFELVIIGADGTRSAPARTTVTAFAANAAPVAHIERLPSVHPGMPVELDGARSFDPDGTPLALAWWFETLPRASALTARDLFAVDGAHARFTPDVAGTYVVGLQASDGASSAETRVVVTARAGNLPPFARAEAATEGAAVVLDATESFDPDAGPAPPAYAWTLVARPAGSASTQLDIQPAGDARALFVPDVEGDYVFRLEVSDGIARDAENVLVSFVRAIASPDASVDAGKSVAALRANEKQGARGRGAEANAGSHLALNVAPRTLTVPAGSQGSVKVKLAGNPHAKTDALLDAAGLPSGVTAKFAQPMVAVGERTSLTLNVGAAVPAGAYPLQVVATPQAPGAVVTATATVVLRVRSGGGVGGEQAVTCGAPNLSGLAQKVYVSPQGNDAAGCGATTATACATIQRGIDACSPSGCGVLVRYGRYRTTATINLRNGVDVYGGCVFAAVANPNYRTLIDASPAPGTPAITAASINAPTLVAGIAVVGKEETSNGVPSIAMAVTASTGLTLARTMLAAGTGGDGAMGGTDPASVGGTGQQSFGSGGGAGGASCAANHTSSAGNGGQGGDVLQYTLDFPYFCFITCPCGYPNVNDSIGRTGLASGSVGGGGGGARAWGGPYCTAPASGNDFIGKTGNPGSDGACATQGGSASAQLFGLSNGQTGGWQPAAGGQGGSGSVGSGGGGGSGGGYCVGFLHGWSPESVTGNPGSGGGGGGCGGNGGYGGQQGGASFALVLTAATVQGLASGNSIVPGPGGVGGRGGTGGQGGAGGAGGNGLPAGPTVVDGDSCPAPSGGGGPGGRGGGGGGGSGGNGGPSVGVLLLGGATNPGTAGVYSGLPGEAGVQGTGGRNAPNSSDPSPCIAPVGNNGMLGGFGLVVDPTRPPINFMLPGDSLVQGQSRTSQDGKVELVMQTDGNFCLYKSGAYEWCSEQAGWGTADKVTMQTDGNLCLSTNGTNTRCSNTYPHPGAYLVVRDDGRVSIFDGPTSLWAIP